MTLAFPSREFDDAVAGVCHGVATDGEMRALRALLLGHAEARDEYLLRVELHARLASEPDLFTQPGVEAADGDPHGLSFEVRRDAGVRPDAAPVRRRPLAWVVALAASLTLAVTGAGSLWWWRSSSRQGATSTAVAMLARAVDARWAGGAAPLRVGSALAPGWLRLESGLAQVVFYGGARVVLEGPAQLQLRSPAEAVCRAGRFLAEVPPPARGFRLRTAQLSVVDQGTSFGLEASGGRTEVHVFKGSVEVAAGTAAERALDAGRAAVVQGGAPARLMPANPEVFAALLDLQQRSLALDALRYDQWRVASARLNADPTLLVHFDFESLGESDATLPNTAAKRGPGPEGAIVGCQRAEGRWREKPALEFQTVNDRVRLAVPGEFESLTLAAWVRVKGLDRQFNSLFMCDGFAPGGIHWLIRNDGVLSLAVKGAGRAAFQILATPPVLTIDRFGMWTHLAVVLDGPRGQLVHYVNGNPVARQALRLGPPYRLGTAELGNWNARSGPHPAPFLIRNLSGSVDEFELFSRALNDAEVRALYREGEPESSLCSWNRAEGSPNRQ